MALQTHLAGQVVIMLKSVEVFSAAPHSSISPAEQRSTGAGDQDPDWVLVYGLNNFFT